MFKLFSAARAAMRAGIALLQRVDFALLIALLGKIATLEEALNQPGQGRAKWEALQEWVRIDWPKAAAWMDEVEDFVTSAVRLFNALRWFRK